MSRTSRISALALSALAVIAPSFAAGTTLNLQMESDNDEDSPPSSTNEIQVGAVETLTLTIRNERISQPIVLPRTQGLNVSGSGYDPHTGDHTFFVTPSHPGNYTIRAFDIRTDSGHVLHVNAFKFRAVTQ